MAESLAYSGAFRPWNKGGGYHSKLLKLQRASGVYAIWSTSGKLLYIGESHTGQLYDTITRHFRDWRVAADDAQGRRRGGHEYKRGGVKVAVYTTEPGAAQDVQLDFIRAMNPRDNVLDGHSIAPVPNPRRSKTTLRGARRKRGRRRTSGAARVPRAKRTRGGFWLQAVRQGRRIVGVLLDDSKPTGAEVVGPYADRAHAKSDGQLWARTGRKPVCPRRNPPDGVLGRIRAVEYDHADDGKRYRHDFERPARLESSGRGRLVVSGPSVRTIKDRGQLFIEG